MSVFAIRLKTLRQSMNLTQPQLAERIGVSRSAISMYELGSREPDFETLEAIADFFNVDMNYLVGGENVDTDESLIILNRNARNLSPEDRKKLLDVAKTIFGDTWGGS
ncbi:MAG: helix-turn-helix transcriptional regulator [Clostridia bacterium]|nr:helix-turn-helix transcriptional regulator [Clostridia bacterium]